MSPFYFLCKYMYKGNNCSILQKTKNDRRSHRVPKTRLRKENRQKLKERRSGLFVKEERLAVSTVVSNDGADEDIDVLG